jgi:hypothetical protein
MEEKILSHVKRMCLEMISSGELLLHHIRLKEHIWKMEKEEAFGTISVKLKALLVEETLEKWLMISTTCTKMTLTK